MVFPLFLETPMCTLRVSNGEVFFFQPFEPTACTLSIVNQRSLGYFGVSKTLQSSFWNDSCWRDSRSCQAILKVTTIGGTHFWYFFTSMIMGGRVMPILTPESRLFVVIFKIIFMTTQSDQQVRSGFWTIKFRRNVSSSTKATKSLVWNYQPAQRPFFRWWLDKAFSTNDPIWQAIFERKKVGLFNHQPLFLFWKKNIEKTRFETPDDTKKKQRQKAAKTPCWAFAWRIIPLSKWLVTPIYKPFRPFVRGPTSPFRGQKRSPWLLTTSSLHWELAALSLLHPPSGRRLLRIGLYPYGPVPS